MLGRWRRRREKHRADKQQGDVHALDREGDPRGGVQSDEYRSADPRDVVEEDGVAMSGPGGAPQEGSSSGERWAVRAKDAGKGDVSDIDVTEDARSRRPARPDGTVLRS